MKKLKEPSHMKEFAEEAKTLAALNHPNVVRILGLMKDDSTGEYYIITEFVAKGDFDYM
jgi:serine/threonine protein kinase